MIGKTVALFKKLEEGMKLSLRAKQIAALILVVVAVIVFIRLVIAMTPSRTVEPLSKYYGLTGDTAKLIINTNESEGKAIVAEKNGYIDVDTASTLVSRIYPDTGDDFVVYTDPDSVYVYTPDELTYTQNGEEKSAKIAPVVKGEDGTRYISTELLQSFFDMQVNVSENPGRIVIFSDDKTSFKYRDSKKETAVRVDANIKSNVLENAKKGTKLYVLGESEEKDFIKVLTEDGVIGYAKLNTLGDVKQEKLSFKRKNDSEIYTSVKRDSKVVLAWHQVTNATANGNLSGYLNGVKGVNVLSPTWFAVMNQEGDLSSIADESYVNLAHSMGMEVWPIVNDFNTDINFADIYGTESGRKALIANIMYFIREYDLDGINIDFEKVTAKLSPDYTQFIRELSVKMRAAGKVLSVDTYIPTEYTAYFDRTEIATVADYLVIMAYDEHYAGSSTAGSVSTVSWVKKGIKNSLELVPEEKLIVGLPFYTRLWRVGKDSLKSEALSMDGGLNAVSNAGKTPTWSEKSCQYVAKWKDGGDTMKIWLEEERSIAAKLDEVSKDAPNCSGVAFWKLGLERDAVWDAVTKWVNNKN